MKTRITILFVFLLTSLISFSQFNVTISSPNMQLCDNWTGTMLSVSINNGVPPYTYLWNDNSTNQTLSVSPSTTSVYSVTVTDSNPSPQTAIDTITITVNPTPIITPQNNIEVCPGELIHINNFISTPMGTAFNWTNNNSTIGLASSGNGNIPDWYAPSNYTGSDILGNILVNTDIGLCWDTMSFTVTIKPTPVITPIADISSCPGELISILNFTSAPSGSSFSWTNSNTDIGLPASGSGPIPNWTLPSNNTGSEIVGTIIVMSELNGCYDTTSFTVTIAPTPTVQQIYDITNCPGGLISIPSFTSFPAGVTFSWTNTNTAIGLPVSGTGNIPDWTAPPNMTGANITGTICVTATLNGCEGLPMCINVSIVPTPIITPIQDISICSGNIISIPAFSSTPSGAMFTWLNNNTSIGLSVIGTGNIPSWVAPVNTTGSDIISNIIVNSELDGCVSETNFNVTINPVPHVTTILNQAVCSGDVVTIQPLSSFPPGASFIWTNSNTAIGLPASGSGNIASWVAPINNTGAPINSTLCVTPTLNGCIGLDSCFNITINSAPDASLVCNSPNIDTLLINGLPYLGVCSNISSFYFSFVNQSTTASTNNSYSIDWGDGTSPFSSTIFSSPAIHQYSTGTYQMSFTVEGNNGCTDTSTYNIYVGSNPAVNFGYTGSADVCAPGTIEFNIYGVQDNTTETTYTITYSDGSPSDVFNHPPPSSFFHTFNHSSCGYTSSNGSMSIPNSFGAYIEATNYCPSTSSAAVVPIQVSDSPIANFEIVPNDSILQNSTLEIVNTSPLALHINNFGECDSTSNIVWGISPSTGWSVLTGTLGNSYNIPDPSLWTVGSDSLIISYSIPGTYTISLLHGNLCGIDTLSKSTFVYPSSTFSIIPIPDISVCSGDNIIVSTFQSIPGGATFSWTNSNTSIGLVANGMGNIPVWTAPLNLTNSPITGIVEVIANLGASSDTTQFTITINPTPNADLICTNADTTTINGLAYYRVCSNVSSNNLNFINQSTTTSTNTNYLIDWGDGTSNYSSSTFSTPIVHQYFQGIHQLTFTVTGNSGCTSSSTYNIYVGSNPAVNLGYTGSTDICAPGAIEFNIYGVSNNTSETTYAVTYSDGSPSDVFNHPPPSTFLHLFSTNSCGATASNGSNTYDNSYGAYIEATNYCPSSSMAAVVPIRVSDNPEADFEIYPNDTISPNSSISLLNTSIDIIEINSSGICDTNSIIVWEVTPSVGWSLLYGNFGNTYNIPIPYLWSIGSDSCDIHFTQPGTYSISQIVGGTCGIDTLIKNVVVASSTSLSINPIGDIITCPNELISIPGFASIPTGASFSWINNNISLGLPSSGAGNIPSWYAPQNNAGMLLVGNIEVVGTLGGDTATTSFSISILPTPDAIQFSDTVVCPGELISFPVFTSFPSGATFTWTNTNVAIGLGTSGTGDLPVWIAPPNNTGVPIVGTICVIPTLDGCDGPPMCFDITIKPTPVIDPTADMVVCPNELISIPGFASVPPATSYSWSNSNTAIGLPAFGTGNIPAWIAPPNNTGFDIVGTIIVTSELDGCNGTDTFTVTIIPTPIMDPVADIEVCPNDPVSIPGFTTTPSGAIFTWTNTNTAIGLPASGTGTIPTWTAPPNNTGVAITGTICVTPTINGCDGPEVCFDVTILPTPVITQTPDTSVYPGDLITIPNFVTTPPGATFIWTNSNTDIGLAASGNGNILPWTAPQNNTGAPIVGIITVTYVLSSCSAVMTFTITVLPTIGISEEISGSDKIILYQNIPNPFVDRTEISFYLPEPTEIKFSVFDIIGNNVTLLTNRNTSDFDSYNHYPKGKNTIVLSSASLKGGTYFYQIESVNQKAIRRMIVIK